IEHRQARIAEESREEGARRYQPSEIQHSSNCSVSPGRKARQTMALPRPEKHNTRSCMSKRKAPRIQATRCRRDQPRSQTRHTASRDITRRTKRDRSARNCKGARAEAWGQCFGMIWTSLLYLTSRLPTVGIG
ncbi:Hypothetical predicted protein, partial [Pelobates cultripes]